MAIKDWHKDERPREKLMSNGARSLTPAELIAIILGSGTKELSAVDLAKQILQSVDYDLSKLENVSLERLQEFNGIGPAKAVILNAAFELGRRRSMQRTEAIKKIHSPSDAYELLKPVIET
jgi:DNA repair protein RadC